LESYMKEVSTDSNADSFSDTPVQYKSARPTKLIPFLWTGADTGFVLVLIFLGMFSRFWILWSPRYCVPIDFEYLSFLHHYSNKTFFFDSEPYLGKQIVRWIAKQTWYETEYIRLRENEFYGNTLYNSLRSISAFFSAASIPIVYFVIRSSHVPSLYAFTGGIFCLFEPSLVASSRWITDRGLSQFFVSMSLLFAALSYHYDPVSNEAKWLTFFQSIFAGFALSTSFSTFSVVLFSIVWPHLRTKNSKQTAVTIAIPIIILYLSCFSHVIRFTKIKPDAYSFDNSTAVKIENQSKQQFRLWHLSSAIKIAGKLIVSRAHALTHSNISVTLRRLTFTEKWTVIWEENDRRAACFTNRLITIPSLVLAILETIFSLRKRSFDTRAFLSMFFVVSVVLYSIEPSESGCMNSYVVTLLSAILFPLCIQRFMRRSYSITTCIIMIFIASVSFLDWATLIYAYYNPHHIFPTWFVQ
jgi:hypothetical protein